MFDFFHLTYCPLGSLMLLQRARFNSLEVCSIVYVYTHTHTQGNIVCSTSFLSVYQGYLRLLPYLNYYKWCCNEYWGVFIIFGCIPKGGIAGLYGSSILIFSVTFLFSMEAIRMCSFTNNTQEFLSLHILANTCYFLSFW